MDGAVGADGIEISLVQQHAAQLTLEMVSKWSLEKERREGRHIPPTRPLHCSPDILLTFELKFNGTHIPPTPSPLSLSAWE